MEDFSKYLQRANTAAVGGHRRTVINYSEDIACSPPINKEARKINKHLPKEDIKTSSQDEIAKLEWEMEKYSSQINESKIKDIIISAHYKKRDLFLKKIEEITKGIHEKCEQCKSQIKSSTKQTYYARDVRLEGGGSWVESPCMRSVRETCEFISSYFETKYSKDAGLLGEDGKEETNNITEERLWNKVEDIAQNYSPDEISHALLTNIQQSTENLKDLSTRINLQRDADNLKFKFETGKLKDVSSKPVLLQTVHQLIEMGQISHFQRFIACEKENNEAWDWKKKLHLLNGEIDNILMSKFDSHKAELLRKYFHCEQEHASCSASATYLQEELTKLKYEQTEKENTVSILLTKYNRIQNFEKTVHAKQTVIKKLIQDNGSAKSRHRKQYEDIVTLVEGKILKQQQQMVDYCRQYQELLSEELDYFTKIPIQNLNCIKPSSGERRLVSDMSINRLNPQFQHPAEDNLKYILKKVQHPIFAPPENVLGSIVETKLECYNNTKMRNSADAKASSLADILAKIDNLKGDLNKLHTEQFQSVVPSLKESEEKTSEIMAECLKFRNSAQAWWEQPAQFLVPWVTVDGFNVEQYMEKFTTHGEILKQMRDGVTE